MFALCVHPRVSFIFPPAISFFSFVFIFVARNLSTAKRRVRFQQESQKSKSLETPYHHTHEQHKLNADMADVQERSSSYSSIPQREPLVYSHTRHHHHMPHQYHHHHPTTDFSNGTGLPPSHELYFTTPV